jgi:hypothetical protein
MMRIDDDNLEQRIGQAFHYRADLLPEARDSLSGTLDSVVLLAATTRDRAMDDEIGQRRRRFNRRVVGVAVASFAAIIAVVVAAAVIASGSGDARSNISPAQESPAPSTAPVQSGSASWDTPADATPLERCAYLPSQADQPMQVHDRSTGTPVMRTGRSICEQSVGSLPPDDVMTRAGLVATFSFSNGQFQREYHEVVTLSGGSAVGPLVPPDDAERRIADASK